jgi:hypothetical protein
MRYLRQSTAATVIVGPIVDRTTALPLTGLSDQSANGRLVTNGTGATFTASSWAHDGGGHYLVGLSTSHTGTVGRLRLSFALDATYLPAWEDFTVLSAAVYDVLFGTVAPSTHTAASVQALVAAGAVASVTAPVTAGTVSDKTGYSLSVAPPTTAAILAAMNATPPDVNVASVDGGLLTSPTVDANVVSVDGSLLTSPVVDANVVSIEAGLLTSPDVTVAAGSIADIAEAVRDVDNTAPAADSLGEAINAGGGGGGGGATAADVWAYATRTLSTAPPTAAAVAAEVWDTAPSGPTLEDIAEAVRDVSNASPTAGSLGEAINSAASAGDPWSTTIPGSYGSGTAGKIIGDNLNATVTSRMATFSYQPPPAANAIRDAVWTGSTRELTAGGLDAISTTLNATPTNFPQWIVWLTTQFRRTRKNKTTGVISVYGTDGTTIITTQTSTDTTGEQTTGVPS